jgi:hypothetical protein
MEEATAHKQFHLYGGTTVNDAPSSQDTSDEIVYHGNPLATLKLLPPSSNGIQISLATEVTEDCGELSFQDRSYVSNGYVVLHLVWHSEKIKVRFDMYASFSNIHFTVSPNLRCAT